MGSSKTSRFQRSMQTLLLLVSFVARIHAECTATIVPTEDCMTSCQSNYCPCSFATTLGRYVSEPWIKADESAISLSSEVDSYLDDENLFFEYPTASGLTEIQGSVGKISYDKAHFGKWAICPGEASIDDAGSCYYSTVPVNTPGLPTVLDFYDASTENKTLVGKAKFTCDKKKSVFKALVDYALDPILALMESLLVNL